MTGALSPALPRPRGRGRGARLRRAALSAPLGHLPQRGRTGVALPRVNPPAPSGLPPTPVGGGVRFLPEGEWGMPSPQPSPVLGGGGRVHAAGALPSLPLRGISPRGGEQGCAGARQSPRPFGAAPHTCGGRGSGARLRRAALSAPSGHLSQRGRTGVRWRASIPPPLRGCPPHLWGAGVGFPPGVGGGGEIPALRGRGVSFRGRGGVLRCIRCWRRRRCRGPGGRGR